MCSLDFSHVVENAFATADTEVGAGTDDDFWRSFGSAMCTTTTASSQDPFEALQEVVADDGETARQFYIRFLRAHKCYDLAVKARNEAPARRDGKKIKTTYLKGSGFHSELFQMISLSKSLSELFGKVEASEKVRTETRAKRRKVAAAAMTVQPTKPLEVVVREVLMAVRKQEGVTDRRRASEITRIAPKRYMHPQRMAMHVAAGGGRKDPGLCPWLSLHQMKCQHGGDTGSCPYRHQ
jgi:hypothetical protein